MPKYEPGDTVIVCPDIAEHQRDYRIGATPEMVNKAGQIVTIRAIEAEYPEYTIYTIEEDFWNWDEAMFTGLAEEDATIEISNSDFIKILGVDKDG